MVGKKPNKGQVNNIIRFPSDRLAKARENTGDKTPSDGVLISDDLAIADAERMIRELKTDLADDREMILDILVDQGCMTRDQVRINEETYECFINVDGKEMETSEFIAHLIRIRMAEETALYQNSKKTD